MVDGKGTGVFRTAASLFGRLLVIIIMCNLICLSFQMLATAVFTDVKGYDVYGYKGDDGNDAEFLYNYSVKDGEDTRYTQYENDGYTLQKRSVRTKMFPLGKAVFLLIAQASCFVTFFAFVYPKIWQCGDRDGCAVRFGRTEYDRFKGLKIGLIASVPTFILYVVFVVLSLSGKPTSAAAYTLFSSYLYSVLNLVYAGKYSFGDFSTVQYILTGVLTAFVPAVTFVAYNLGFKGTVISNKIIYKKEEKK